MWPCRTFCIEGFVCCRYRQPTLRLLPAGASVAGWDIFLPLDQRALSRRTRFSGLASPRLSYYSGITKHELREGTCQKRFPDAGWTQKDE